MVHLGTAPQVGQYGLQKHPTMWGKPGKKRYLHTVGPECSEYTQSQTAR